MRRPVAQRREIRNEPQVPEHRGDDEVGGHREHIPQQRRREIHPEGMLVGIRRQIQREPGASRVQQREDRRAHDGKDRHGFGESRYAVSPPLTEEEQDGGDQCPRVSDADPEHEVHDIKAPGDGLVDAPHTEAIIETDPETDKTDPQHGRGHRNGDPPGTGRDVVQRGADDRIDLRGGRTPGDNGLFAGVVDCGGAHALFSEWMFRNLARYVTFGRTFSSPSTSYPS